LGVTIPATVPQMSEIPERLMNYLVVLLYNGIITILISILSLMSLKVYDIN
jgi:hypothetical protein